MFKFHKIYSLTAKKKKKKKKSRLLNVEHYINECSNF